MVLGQNRHSHQIRTGRGLIWYQAYQWYGVVGSIADSEFLQGGKRRRHVSFPVTELSFGTARNLGKRQLIGKPGRYCHAGVIASVDDGAYFTSFAIQPDLDGGHGAVQLHAQGILRRRDEGFGIDECQSTCIEVHVYNGLKEEVCPERKLRIVAMVFDQRH